MSKKNLTKKEETLNICGINCKIIYKKIKNIYIQIKDGKVIIKVPYLTKYDYIEKNIKGKKDWIINNLNKQSLLNKYKNPCKNGDPIYILGKLYYIRIIYTEKKRSSIYSDSTYVYCEINNSNFYLEEKQRIEVKKLIDKLYKTIAVQEVQAAMENVYKYTGLQPQEYNIKKLKATWGICSNNKKISINQNLMAYSRHAIEYVCLHEICHLKYMNHSKEFWNMIEKYMPDYKLAKQELKEHTLI